MVVCIFIDEVCAQKLPGVSPDFARAVNLLRESCGYSLDISLLDSVKSSKVSFEGDVFHAEFYVELKPVGRNLMASLSFACFLPGKDLSGSDEDAPLTARREIAEEDSGGRYARHVVWERRYSGLNWTGTIAYADSVFGDGVARKIPAYFMTCPEKVGLACFSLEFEKNDLTSKEINEVQNLIHEISVIDHPGR